MFRTLAAITILGVLAGPVAGQDIPRKFRDDRKDLTTSLEALKDATALTNSFSDRPNREATESEERKVQKLLKKGLKSGRKVDDAFLDYLHPQLRYYFKEVYLQSQQLFLEGYKEGDLQKQVQALTLQRQWNAYWKSNADGIFRRAYP